MEYSLSKWEEVRRKKEAKKDRLQPKREVKKLRTMIWTLLEVSTQMMMALSSESQYPLEREVKVQRAQVEIDQILPILVLKGMA